MGGACRRARRGGTARAGLISRCGPLEALADALEGGEAASTGLKELVVAVESLLRVTAWGIRRRSRALAGLLLPNVAYRPCARATIVPCRTLGLIGNR